MAVTPIRRDAEGWRGRARRRMKELELTQEDLKAVFGVTTRAGVGHYLTGRSEPTPDQITALARKLRVSVQELLTGEPPVVGTVDPVLLRAVMDALLQAAQGAGKDLDPERIARLAAFLYSEASDNPAAIQDRRRVADLIALIT